VAAAVRVGVVGHGDHQHPGSVGDTGSYTESGLAASSSCGTTTGQLAFGLRGQGGAPGGEAGRRRSGLVRGVGSAGRSLRGRAKRSPAICNRLVTDLVQVLSSFWPVAVTQTT